MTRTQQTRRTVLKGLGAAVATAAVPAAATTRAAAAEEWTIAKTPVDTTLHDVVDTTADAHAVGGGGVVLRRTADEWETALDGGPTGNGNDLYGADVTDDGRRVWFAGASGAIGEYDVEADVLYDHSAPNDVTNNFNDVSVAGAAGDANVYVAGDSGSIYYSFENGATGTWDGVTPGSGSNINAVDVHDSRSGHAVDGNTTVFETTDGLTWEKRGVADADSDFYAVDSDGSDQVWIAGGNGTIYRRDDAAWVRSDAGDASLRDIEVGDDGEMGIAVGSGGAVRTFTDGRWTVSESPTGANLKALLRGDPDIAVGAGGVVIER